MRKAIMFLGTILIAAVILISGSAVATWHYAVAVDHYAFCTNPDEALDAPDGVYASIGVDGPPTILGVIFLDLGLYNGMETNQQFWVFARSDVPEEYRVRVLEEDFKNPSSWEYGYDDADEDFYTPSLGGLFRYIEIQGWTGGGYDPVNGPEIDAVGFEV
jgi:hypothetical protein